jgi:hypothetical protein
MPESREPACAVYSNAKDGHPIHMNELTEKQVIDQLADRLVPIYPAVEPDDVSRVVHEEYTRYEGSPIRDYIPLLVERHAKEELDKLVA